MKKFLIFLTCLFLTACNSDNNADSNNQQDDIANDNESNVETFTVDFDVWDVEPVYEWDDITIDFNAHSKWWNITIYADYDPYGKYESGGVIFKKNNLYSFMNSSGVVTNDRFNSYNTFLDKVNMGSTECDSVICWLNDDYSVLYSYRPDGIVGPGMSVDSNFNVYADGEYTSSDPYSSFGLEERGYDSALIDSDAIVLTSKNENKVIDFIPSNSSIIGYSSGLILTYQTNDDSTYINNESNGHDYIFYNTNGEQIGQTYDGAYNFLGEYAAVKKDDKWGYIDTKGNTVIDFVFDKATPIVDGKAWVIFEDRCGKINIQKFIDKQIKPTSSILNVNSYDVYNDEFIYLEITVDSIKIRKEPSLSAERVDYPSANDLDISSIKKGTFVAASKKVEADGYTWYCIANIDEVDGESTNMDMWIADQNGEWIKIIN